MVEIPAPLAQLAAERGLGTCDHWFRRRTTAVTVLGILAAAGVTLLLLVLTAAPLIILVLPVLVAWLLLRRRRDAGLYLFDGGFVVLSGWSAPQVRTWDQAGGLTVDRGYEHHEQAAAVVASRRSGG